MATDNFEAELEGLVKKLNKIQSAVGGKTSKKYVTGKDGKIDPFLELQESIMDRIRKIQQVIEEIRDFGGKESKSRDTVVNQQELRRLISLCSEEWQEMNNLYQNEARKRKSKFTQDELKERLRILTMLQRDIEEIKDNQRAGYVADYKPRILVSMEESELFNAPLGLEEGKGTKTSPASRNVEMMTDQHRAGLQMLKERDAVIVGLVWLSSVSCCLRINILMQ